MSGIVTKYIERFLCVLTPDASIKVIQLDEITAIDGVTVRSDQIGAGSISDAKVAALLNAISATTFAELSAEKASHAETQSTLATVTSERDAALAQSESLQAQVDTIPDLQSQIAELTAEVARLTALVPPPVPDAFLSADWSGFRNAILSDEAVQRVASGNPTAWPLMVLYLTQLSSTPSRGADIAQLWTIMESHTPVTTEEVARINAIAEECGVPLRMNDDGSIG